MSASTSSRWTTLPIAVNAKPPTQKSSSRIARARSILSSPPSAMSKAVAVPTGRYRVRSPHVEEERVKVRGIETFLCDAGWRPWIFVKVTTDDGLVGWGECSDGRNPHGVVGAVKDYEDVVVGQDPRKVE